MSSNDSNSNSNGVSFGGLLTVLFIGLKLGGVIDWSWWWVLSPIWISISLAAVILIIGWIIHVFNRRSYKRR